MIGLGACCRSGTAWNQCKCLARSFAIRGCDDRRLNLSEAALGIRMEDIAELEQTLRSEAREQRVEGCSHAQMRDLTQEFGAVVFLLNGKCLSYN